MTRAALLAALLAAGATPPAAGAERAAPRPAPHTPGRAAPAGALPAPRAEPRTYVVRAVNGRPLPFQDRFATTPGYEHRVHLERFLVRLSPDGTFTFTVWGAYRDVPRDTPPAGPTGGAGQVSDHAVRGRWSLRGDAITLTPERSRKGRQYGPATGRLTGAGLVLRYEVGWAYPGGQFGSRRYHIAGAHDPSYL